MGHWPWNEPTHGGHSKDQRTTCLWDVLSIPQIFLEDLPWVVLDAGVRNESEKNPSLRNLPFLLGAGAVGVFELMMCE